MEEIVIKESNGSRTVVRLQEFQGQMYMDIRKQYKNASGNEWLDTKKGIFIEAEAETLDELNKAIRKVKRSVK